MFLEKNNSTYFVTNSKLYTALIGGIIAQTYLVI